MDGAKPQIRGKDLVGGVMVMPMGLDAAIKKRTSGEFNMEQKSEGMSFSQVSQQKSSSVRQETRQQLAPFQEESFLQPQQQDMFGSSAHNQQSLQQSFQQPSMQTSSSTSKQMSSSSQSSSMSMNSSTSFQTQQQTSSFQSSSSQEHQQFALANQEIKQDNLKTQIVSAITDLEGDRDMVDFSKENKTIDLMSPPQAKSPTPKVAEMPVKQESVPPVKQDVFSPPPLERFEPPQKVLEEVPAAQFQPQPESQPLSNGAPATNGVPTRNGLQNGFNDFVSSSIKEDDARLYSLRRPRQFKGRAENCPRPVSMPVDFAQMVLDLPDVGSMHSKHSEQNLIQEEGENDMNMEVQQIQEFSQSITSNETYKETSELQQSDSNSMLQKIMTPASVEYDTGSLKRRDPKKMFTDSSFYNSKYHPTIADQVEMAHRLSSAMFNEQNKGTKGAKMYLSRMEHSGGFGEDIPKHDNIPNMKLVMNPEGKVSMLDDLPPDQRPDFSNLAVHAAPNLKDCIPEVADPVAESLNAGVGRGGALFNKRKEKAASWIVDDSTVGRINPHAAADKFIQEQTEQQLALQQQKMFEQQQKFEAQQQQVAAKEAEQLQQQREAQAAFQQQQQFKQEQSMEVRRIQEMAKQQIDFPQDFQHANLKGRSFTPSLDLGVHNVQGINVWANTAPRGWGAAQRSGATPVRNQSNPPSLAVQPATPSFDRDAETRRQQEEQLRLQQEEQLRLQQEEQLRIQQEEQLRIQQEEQLRIQQEQQLRIQQEEQLRIQQEEQLRIQQEQQLRIQQEEQLRIQQEEMRRQQEEQMRIQQEEMRRQQEEEMRRQEEEMRRQQEEQLRRQQEEQMRRQQEEQMRIQQEEQIRIQQEQMRVQEEQMRRQQEMQRMEQEQMQMRLAQEEQQRQQQQMIQQQQQQQMLQQQQQMMTQETQQQSFQQTQEAQQQTSYEQRISSITKAGGFSYGAIPTKEPRPQSQQSQVVSSQQQSSSSFSQQSVNQTSYECHNINGGVMKGYREKNGAFEQQQQVANNRDSGIFGGINGDANSLVEEEFDYKKHSVKDLAKHFALVKPKTNIPHNILPEQRMFNGEQAPQLNYLGAGENGGAAVLQASGQSNRREVSQQDIEASKQAYELKKKQQMEAQQQSSSSTTTTSSSSTVVRRTESSSEQKTERRMSLRDSLMMDPAKAHADAGLIDPSAILRGCNIVEAARSTSEGIGQADAGETDKLLNKWDNHNTIARGWTGVRANYHPVTFRNIYNVETQKTETSHQI